jgi:putative transposase
MTDRTRKPYLTDLTDEQWAILEPMIPPAKPGGRPRAVDMREVINTILYLNRTGCQWDLLPHDLLPKSTVYEYFAQWRDDGTWQRMMDALRTRVRQVQAPSKQPTPSAGSISIVKRCRQPSRAVNTALMAAKKSTGANAISVSIPWAFYWPWW